MALRTDYGLQMAYCDDFAGLSTLYSPARGYGAFGFAEIFEEHCLWV